MWEHGQAECDSSMAHFLPPLFLEVLCVVGANPINLSVQDAGEFPQGNPPISSSITQHNLAAALPEVKGMAEV